jgi:hypothetical protein
MDGGMSRHGQAVFPKEIAHWPRPYLGRIMGRLKVLGPRVGSAS